MTSTTNTTRKTRASGTRKVAWKPSSSLEVPKELKQPGFKYRWIRHELRGDDHVTNVHNRTRQGYVPVNAEELAGFDVDVMDGGKHSGVVRCGDLILAKCPEEIAESRQEFFDAQAEKLQRLVDHDFDREGQNAMPIIRESTSTVSKGHIRASPKVSFED